MTCPKRRLYEAVVLVKADELLRLSPGVVGSQVEITDAMGYVVMRFTQSFGPGYQCRTITHAFAPIEIRSVDDATLRQRLGKLTAELIAKLDALGMPVAIEPMAADAVFTEEGEAVAITGKKYDADIPEGHAMQERRKNWPGDIRLRSCGFKILSRPEHGPAVWVRGGEEFTEAEALAACEAEAVVQ